MKKIFSLAIFILSLLLLLPLSAVKEIEKSVSVLNTVPNIAETHDSFKILDTSTDKITELSVEDYIFGVVAAEMPALYEKEALKAQAVAAYTFALFRKTENADKSYDITNDPLCDQSFITEQTARERWGNNADEYCEKIKSATAEIENRIITYEKQPILAVYHAISFGTTEDAKNVWGKEYPYLKSVSSIGDKLCDGYISTAQFSDEKVKETLSAEMEVTGEAQNYFGTVNRTEAGTVDTITVCGKELKGSRIRSLFNLRSSNFEVKYQDGNFIFTTYGYGHAVGLSQNGANYMAKQGADFEEILTHYYQGCKITEP